MLAVVLLACGDSLAPFQPEITNAMDNFQFQATGLTGVTTTVQYTWQNTGTTANVNLSSAVTGGSATLTIRDAAGTTVYTHALDGSGTSTTTSGTTGGWTIVVALTNTAGTLNFRVQKP